MDGGRGRASRRARGAAPGDRGARRSRRIAGEGHDGHLVAQVRTGTAMVHRARRRVALGHRAPKMTAGRPRRTMPSGRPRRTMRRMADDPVFDAAAAREASLARFARLVARPEPEIDLALGALLIAGLDARSTPSRGWTRWTPSPSGCGSASTRRRHRPRPSTAPRRAVSRAGISRATDRSTPSGARHSWLDRVLVARIGLPISLAIVELEVAVAAGAAPVGHRAARGTSSSAVPKACCGPGRRRAAPDARRLPG